MEISKTTGLDSSYYLQEDTVPIDDGSNQRLSQEDFFALLTEQLANQDPTKPVDNDQMVSQMTSFSISEGIDELNVKFSDFASTMTSNQALQASSLIGQDVLLQGNVGYLSDTSNGMSGVVITDQTTQDMQITIESVAGELIKTIDAGTQSAGNIQFSWDGKDANGNDLPAGNYVVYAQGIQNGESTTLPTGINRHVDSVSFASNNQGVILNLDGETSINLNEVIQIGG
ncbi:flagellar hook assembly protein FlgD [Aliiglaciecola lipolytica]|uniref:Basal-body rod modification protein FlgD n=1 Tax=Aliiglaciecola lipolytica E3 TaxID=1127673 RepID=K6XU13_9ALTE|nr:flagellar hook assembly protein FlgD [Aliiglaciecola lipolytica]GAC15176.1 flagellar basal-body rod modification protein FlgD [Aliiglaciecola lipolytica E3]